MNLRQILDFINFTANKVQEGNTMSKDQFNTLLVTYNDRMFEDEFAAVEVQAKSQGLMVYDLLYNYSSLRPFRVRLGIATNGGAAPLPSNYKHYITFIGKYGSQERDIEVVSEAVMNIRRTSILESPASIKPYVCIYDTEMVFKPKDIGVAPNGIEMVYLRKPLTPFYDTCISESSGLEVYMPALSQIRAAGLIYNLYESATSGVILESNVVSPTGVYPYTSQTVELEWDEKMQQQLINHLLYTFGVNTRTQLAEKQ